jgi:hypothetical protein
MAHSLRPTMKARNVRTAGGSPIMVMTSTAGTEASTAMLRYRELGLSLIGEQRAGAFYFAEWSPPPGVDVMDTRWWGWANPALGQTLELQSMLIDADHPDRSSFLRASLNQFVNADACWLQPGNGMPAYLIFKAQTMAGSLVIPRLTAHAMSLFAQL